MAGKQKKQFDEQTCIAVTNRYDTAIDFVVDVVGKITGMNETPISPWSKINSDDMATLLDKNR